MGGIHIQHYFRNIAEGATVVKDTFALNEFIFKASDNGQLYIDAATNNKVILRPGDNTTAQAAVQQKNEDYTTVVST
jgi:hypothetical protein